MPRRDAQWLAHLRAQGSEAAGVRSVSPGERSWAWRVTHYLSFVQPAEIESTFLLSRSPCGECQLGAMPWGLPRERQSPDWRGAYRQSGDWRSQGRSHEPFQRRVMCAGRKGIDTIAFDAVCMAKSRIQQRQLIGLQSRRLLQCLGENGSGGD